jgi:hypothetical protein
MNMFLQELAEGAEQAKIGEPRKFTDETRI